MAHKNFQHIFASLTSQSAARIRSLKWKSLLDSKKRDNKGVDLCTTKKSSRIFKGIFKRSAAYLYNRWDILEYIIRYKFVEFFFSSGILLFSIEIKNLIIIRIIIIRLIYMCRYDVLLKMYVLVNDYNILFSYTYIVYTSEIKKTVSLNLTEICCFLNLKKTRWFSLAVYSWTLLVKISKLP